MISERLQQAERTGRPAAERQVSRLFLAAIFLIAALAVTYVFQGWRAGVQVVGITVNFTMFVIFYRSVFKGRLSLVDPGMIFMFVVFVYTAIPLLAFEAFNFNFGIAADSRLANIALDDDIISRIVADANAVMAGFGAAYLAFRTPRMPGLPTVDEAAVTAMWCALILSLVARIALGASGGDSYTDEYLTAQSLPLFALQILNIVSDALYVGLFGLLIHYTLRRRYLMMAALVAGCLALVFLATSARTPLAVIVFAVLVVLDHLRRRLTVPMIAGIVAVALVLFTALGAVRGGSDNMVAVIAQSEFLAVFTTALDIHQIFLTGSALEMNATLLLSDLIRLVPQQLVGFQKIDPASWYVSTFYPIYSAEGGGLAFGMLAETELSGGVYSALVRGLALGGVISLALRPLTGGASVWRYIIYLWLTISIYQCFRDTTFTLAGRFAFQFGPATFATFALATILRRPVADRPSSPGARWPG